MEKKNPGKQMTDLLNSLSGEQREKLISCKGEGELAACLGELGAALPDELLDQVAGGLLDYEEDPEYVQLTWEYAVEYDRRLKEAHIDPYDDYGQSAVLQQLAIDWADRWNALYEKLGIPQN